MLCILYKSETDFFDLALTEEVYIGASEKGYVHLYTPGEGFRIENLELRIGNWRMRCAFMS